MAQMKASAPEGLERLQKTHVELAAQAASLAAPAPLSQDELEARAQELMESLGAAEETLNAAVCEEREAREELVSLRARVAGHAEQIDKLVAELGAPAARTSAREAKLAAVNDAQIGPQCSRARRCGLARKGA